MVYFFYIVGIFYRIFGIFYHSFGTFLLHFQEFIRLHICTNQLSLEKLRYVEDDGEDEGRDDVGGEVQGGGRGHLRMNKVKKSKMGHNFILKSTNIVTFLFQDFKNLLWYWIWHCRDKNKEREQNLLVYWRHWSYSIRLNIGLQPAILYFLFNK